MIQFPETAQAEWQIISEAAGAAGRLRKRIELDTRIEGEVEKMRMRHEAAIMFQQELDAEVTPALVMGTLADFLAQPNAAPADLIDGVMKERGVTLVLGPSGAGKTTMVLQMAHSLLTGTDWLGQPVQKIGGSVGLLSYDQDARISVNWMSRAGLPLDKVQVVNAYGMGNPLNVPKFRAQIAAAWRLARTDVVIVDSFSASFTGADQNDAGATQAYYTAMKNFAFTEVGAASLIIIVHSTDGSPLKPRGSTVHKDAADSVVAVTVDQTAQRAVQMVKYRAGLGQHEMSKVIVTAPDSVTHLVRLDTGAMTLGGLSLPVGSTAAAGMFSVVPEPHEAPDTDSDETEEDDDL